MTKWKWTDRKKGILEVNYADHLIIEMKMSEEGLAYFDEKGCTCRPVPIVELNTVIVAGQDDCPVHGFGENDEDTA